MKKRYVKLGVALLAILTLFSSIFHSTPHVVKAQTPTPNSEITFNFTDGGRRNIDARYKVGEGSIDYGFTTIGEIASDKIAGFNRLDSRGLKSNIWGFRLTNPVVRCGGAQDNTVVTNTTDSNIVMIIGLDEIKWKYIMGGLYLAPRPYSYGLKYELINSSNCSGLGNEIMPFIRAANSDTEIPVIGYANLDKNGICTSLASNWEALKGNIRDFLTEAPETNSNWSKSQSTSVNPVLTLPVFFFALNPLAGLAAGAIQLTVAGVYPEWYGRQLDNYTNSTIQFYLSDEGFARARTMKEQVEKIREAVAMLSSKGGGGTWPCSQKLKKFKFNKALENEEFQTLDELAAALDSMLALFRQFANSMLEPISTAEEVSGVCEIKDQSNITNMISQAFCGLIVNLKSWADSFYCWALGLMESSIGVATSEQQKPSVSRPNNVCSPEYTTTGTGASSSASSPSTSPSSSTPANNSSPTNNSGGESAANAYVLRAKVTYTLGASTRYTALKTAAQTNSGSIWAKIGPLDQNHRWIPNSQHTYSASIKFESWDDLTRTVQVVITSSSVIPTTYSSQAVLAGTGSDNYLLFSEVNNNMVNSGKYENLACSNTNPV